MMKKSELTEEQLQYLADIRPNWMADNHPHWMARNRPFWMANIRPDWDIIPDEIEALLTAQTGEDRPIDDVYVSIRKEILSYLPMFNEWLNPPFPEIPNFCGMSIYEIEGLHFINRQAAQTGEEATDE